VSAEITVVMLNVSTGVLLRTYVVPSAAGRANVYGVPVLVGDIAYFGCSLGVYIALNVTTGMPMWVRTITQGDGVYAPLSLWGSKLVIGTLSGTIVVLSSSTGATLSSYTTPGVPRLVVHGLVSGVITQVLVVNGVAYYSTSTPRNNFFAFNLGTMTQLWNVTLAANYFAYTSPVISNGVLYTTTSEGSLWALNPVDGSVLWTYNTANSLAGVYGTISVVNLQLLLMSATAMMFMVNTQTRAVLLSNRLAFGAAPNSHPVFASASSVITSSLYDFAVAATCPP